MVNKTYHIKGSTVFCQADNNFLHNAASDQELHCLLTLCSIKMNKKSKYHPTTLNYEMVSSY